MPLLHTLYTISIWRQSINRYDYENVANTSNIAYTVSHGIHLLSAYVILGQSYHDMYCIINMIIIVGYHPVYAIYHHEMLAADRLMSHRIDLECYNR